MCFCPKLTVVRNYWGSEYGYPLTSYQDINFEPAKNLIWIHEFPSKQMQLLLIPQAYGNAHVAEALKIPIHIFSQCHGRKSAWAKLLNFLILCPVLSIQLDIANM